MEETLEEGGDEEQIDWSAVPLPAGWTKKLHDISGKVNQNFTTTLKCTMYAEWFPYCHMLYR